MNIYRVRVNFLLFGVCVWSLKFDVKHDDEIHSSVTQFRMTPFCADISSSIFSLLMTPLYVKYSFYDQVKHFERNSTVCTQFQNCIMRVHAPPTSTNRTNYSCG